MKWPEITIPTPTGRKRGIAPFIISASRATDIPAFHANWLMNRLRAGYCLWKNPFNAAQRQYVSFAKCAALVFWSKNPAPLLPRLAEIEDMGFQFYFQFTLNDYEAEGLEPGLPPLKKRLEIFRRLSGRIGKRRLLWRFDPVILGGGLSPKRILGRLAALAGELAPHAGRLSFSFLDMYRKTAANLKKLDPSFHAPEEAEMRLFCEGLIELKEKFSWPFSLAACAEETGPAFSPIGRASCVDAALIAELCPENMEIQRLAGPALAPGLAARRLDSGQRPLCRCAPSKDIGAYDTCMHLCAYCYANRSPRAAIRGFNRASPESESL